MNDITPPARPWQPDASLPVGRARARMLARARAFFAAHDVLEVETPYLSAAAVSDPHLESLAVRLQVRPDAAWYLHTSPEFAMKRLLCAGWPDIYQICKVFRDGEVGPRHQPEFTMVEWYRRDVSMQAMMQHTADFITQMLDERQPARSPVYLSYADAFREFAGIDPLNDSLSDIQDAARVDAGLRESLGDDRNAWLDLLLSTRVAPSFTCDALTILHHYPADQAALAQLCPDDYSLADRFEVFCGKTELANGYAELRDADEQERRCEQDQQYRRDRGRPVRPLDREFLAALRSGLPACCGVAVGFDRLLMLNTGASELRDVQTFAAVSPTNEPS
jgi:elongation factor P--(R)-beta-lysine ligase